MSSVFAALTADAHSPFSGYFNTHFDSSGPVDAPGNPGTGSLQVSFFTTGGDSCYGDDASWSAHG